MAPRAYLAMGGARAMIEDGLFERFAMDEIYGLHFLRNVPPASPLVLSVTTFRGGTAYNVVPKTAHLKGPIRYYDEAAADLVMACMRAIAQLIEDVAFRNGKPVLDAEDKAATCNRD